MGKGEGWSSAHLLLELGLHGVRPSVQVAHVPVAEVVAAGDGVGLPAVLPVRLGCGVGVVFVTRLTVGGEWGSVVIVVYCDPHVALLAAQMRYPTSNHDVPLTYSDGSRRAHKLRFHLYISINGSSLNARFVSPHSHLTYSKTCVLNFVCPALKSVPSR